MHILATSVPLSAVLLLGWGVLAVLRMRVPRNPESQRQPGVLSLALLNIAAPVLLFLELGWVA